MGRIDAATDRIPVSINFADRMYLVGVCWAAALAVRDDQAGRDKGSVWRARLQSLGRADGCGLLFESAWSISDLGELADLLGSVLAIPEGSEEWALAQAVFRRVWLEARDRLFEMAVLAPGGESDEALVMLQSADREAPDPAAVPYAAARTLARVADVVGAALGLSGWV